MVDLTPHPHIPDSESKQTLPSLKKLLVSQEVSKLEDMWHPLMVVIKIVSFLMWLDADWATFLLVIQRDKDPQSLFYEQEKAPSAA